MKRMGKSRLLYQKTNERNNRFAVLYMVSSLALLLLIFYFLIIEIRKKDKISRELMQEKDHFRVTLETIAEGLIRTDKGGEIVYMNPAAEKLTGFRINEAKKYPFEKIFDAVIEESGISYQVVLESILLNGKAIEYDGDIILHPQIQHPGIIHVSGSPILELNKEISGVLLVFYDVTERTMNENKIKESEIFINGVVDSLRPQIVVINSAGIIIKANKPWLTFAYDEGKTGEEAFGEGTDYFEAFLKRNPSDDLAREAKTGIKEVLKGTISEFYIEYSVQSASGEKWFYMRAKKFEGSETMVVIEHHDITIRKKAETELMNAHDNIQLLLDSIAEGAYGVDNNGICTFVNKSFLHLLGYNNANELIGKKIHPIIHHSYADGSLYPESECKMLSSRQTKQNTNVSDEVFWRKDGIAIPVEYWSYPIIQNDKVLGAICTFIDISERKTFEKRILDYKFALDESMLVDLSDSNGIIRYVNDNFCKISKYSREELIGKDHRIFNSGYHSKEVFKELWKTVLSGKVWKKEVRNKAKDGSYFWVDTTIVPFLDNNNQPYQYIVVRTDITSRKQAQEEIIQKSEELKLLSGHLQNIREQERTYLAREIHDELGQQLTVMKMDATWLYDKLQDAGEPVRKRTAELKDMLDQTVMTVRRIASDLRPSILDDMGLCAAIEWQLTEFGKKSGVKTKFESLQSELPLQDIVKSNLFRIVQESLTNVSRYAHAKKVEVSLQQNNGHLLLTVKDDGVGFDAEKIIAKQTFGILGMKERSFMIGGTYEINSKPGKGTSVKVQVPYYKQASKQLKML